MPKMVLTAAYVSINAVTYHDKAKSIELTTEVEEKDVTTFASLGWKEVLGGLKSGSLSVGLFNDMTDNSIDETMWGLQGTVVPFEVRATQASVSASNPSYTGNVLIPGWTPVSGSVGDVVEVDLDMPTSGVVTRNVA
jgi:hypothetical protein